MESLPHCLSFFHFYYLHILYRRKNSEMREPRQMKIKFSNRHSATFSPIIFKNSDLFRIKNIPISLQTKFSETTAPDIPTFSILILFVRTPPSISGFRITVRNDINGYSWIPRRGAV